MSWAVTLAGSLALSFTISPAFAEAQCAARSKLACEMASIIVERSADLVPDNVESFGIRFKVLSLEAEGPKLVVGVQTRKNRERLERQLAGEGTSLSKFRLLVESEVMEGVCGTVEGPVFLNAGGQVEAIISSGDRQPLFAVLVQSCVGV